MLERIQSDQFETINNTDDSIVLKFWKSFNKELLTMKKGKDINENFYNKLRSTGSQPACLYNLANVHKKFIPLRFVLSLPGC